MEVGREIKRFGPPLDGRDKKSGEWKNLKYWQPGGWRGKNFG